MKRKIDSQDDQFNSITERNVQQRAKSISHLTRHRLGCKREQSGERDDGNGIHSKDDTAMDAVNLGDGNADGYKDEQDIKPAVSDGQPGIAADLVNKGALLGGICVFFRWLPGLGCRLYDRPRPCSLRRCMRWDVPRWHLELGGAIVVRGVAVDGSLVCARDVMVVIRSSLFVKVVAVKLLAQAKSVSAFRSLG